MKLMYCQQCGDIIAPHPVNEQPRWCRCKRHAVWWLDGARGTLRLWDAVEGPERSRDGEVWYPREPRAYVIGLTNLLLQCPKDISIDAALVQEMIEAHDDSYIFKRWRSLVIRIRPGESGDTRWSRLPPGAVPEPAWTELTRVICLAAEFAEHRAKNPNPDASLEERNLLEACGRARPPPRRDRGEENMSQAANREEYARLAVERAVIHGFGLDTAMTLPCVFCAAGDFVTYKILEMEKVMAEPHTCKECGRSAKMVFNRGPNGVSFEIVQTGGDDQPEWLEPKMRRVP